MPKCIVLYYNIEVGSVQSLVCLVYMGVRDDKRGYCFIKYVVVLIIIVLYNSFWCTIQVNNINTKKTC